jgi:hypothetical protein
MIVPTGARFCRPENCANTLESCCWRWTEKEPWKYSEDFTRRKRHGNSSLTQAINEPKQPAHLLTEVPIRLKTSRSTGPSQVSNHQGPQFETSNMPSASPQTHVRLMPPTFFDLRRQNVIGACQTSKQHSLLSSELKGIASFQMPCRLEAQLPRPFCVLN